MTDYIISEECLERTCLCTICHIADNPCDEIRMNTLLEHDTRIRQEERNKVLDELTCLTRDEIKFLETHCRFDNETNLFCADEILKKIKACPAIHILQQTMTDEQRLETIKLILKIQSHLPWKESRLNCEIINGAILGIYDILDMVKHQSNQPTRRYVENDNIKLDDYDDQEGVNL